MRPLVSVICPVYNAEDYLQQTLECIINQTYKELEILMIDDGSSDNSLAICLREAKKDERIKVKYRKQNGHISNASNDALEMAKELLQDKDFLQKHIDPTENRS